MADIPSPRVAKRFSLGSTDPNTNGNLSVSYVNLAKQALPVQGGLIGYFGGALLIVTTGAFTGGGSVKIKLQGAVDDPATAGNWFDISLSSSVDSSSPATSASGKTSVVIPGPLPQYIRAYSTKTGTVNTLAAGVSAEIVAFG